MACDTCKDLIELGIDAVSVAAAALATSVAGPAGTEADVVVETGFETVATAEEDGIAVDAAAEDTIDDTSFLKKLADDVQQAYKDGCEKLDEAVGKLAKKLGLPKRVVAGVLGGAGGYVAGKVADGAIEELCRRAKLCGETVTVDNHTSVDVAWSIYNVNDPVATESAMNAWARFDGVLSPTGLQGGTMRPEGDHGAIDEIENLPKNAEGYSYRVTFEWHHSGKNSYGLPETTTYRGWAPALAGHEVVVFDNNLRNPQGDQVGGVHTHKSLLA